MSATALAEGESRGTERRTLTVASGAHVLHDGYTDLLIVLLPLWQTEFGLTYAAVGLMRALYVGVLALCQVPAARLGAWFGARLVLGVGTMLAGAAFILAGVSDGLALLVAALVLGGLGASVQHPIASNLVAASYEGARSRGALAVYNFAGDLGKMAFPAAAAWILASSAWRPTAIGFGLVGLVAALAVFLVPATALHAASGAAPASTNAPRRGFPLLVGIGILDSATRMAFITFLPFVLLQKGAELPTLGLALTLLAVGGAAGKLVCGWLGARLGVTGAVFLTEGLTAAGIVALIVSPLVPAVALLPVIGMAMNGTSSVLYGTVPELVRPERRARAFGLFYSATIGGGAVAPVVFGALGDAAGVIPAMGVTAALILLTLPLAWALRPAFARS